MKPDELFATLVNSDPGRDALIARGVPQFVLANLQPKPSKARAEWRASAARLAAIQALSSYGRMLTETEPPHGRVVEREVTIKALVRTLSKMKRRNAIVIGPPGTGKSAIIYELARRIFHDDPSLTSRIREMDIFELSPTFLRSGASMVGQYEERVKNLLKVLTANPRIVLFIDEIHAMFQSGVHERGPFSDANESFKGALGRGEITCIGCTTPGEYRHSIEPDKALERRFGIIRLEPPSKEATLAILKGRHQQMEDYFAPLKIPDAMLRRAIELTEEYLPSRFQPDKSIQLLDEACAYCATADEPPAEVGEASLMQALEDIIGHSIARTESLEEGSVFKSLSKKIVGQDEVLHEIARAFVAALGGWSKRSGPRGVFLFGGPTGVGKTETALELSKILGAGRESLIRVDCNTLQGSGSESGPIINRLLGVPPGYVGFARGQGGILSRVRDLPECVVLFDEFEKAGPAVGRLLLQIIDNGQVEDTEGNLLDFRRAFIIFTTNAGCVYDPHRLGFTGGDPDQPAIPAADLDGLKRELRSLGLGEEFLARMTHILLFKGLDPVSIRTILGRQLDGLRRTSELKGLSLTWEPELITHLTAQWQPRFGVRFLGTVLRNRIVEQLGVAEAQGELRGVKSIRLEVLKLNPKDSRSDLSGVATRQRDGDSLVIRVA